MVDDGGVLDFGALPGAPADLKSALASDALTSLTGASGAKRHDPSTLTWLPPIGNPAKILCIGLNYESHRLETGRASARHPAVFTRFADTLVGHEQPLLRPAASMQLDFEGELAVIIGRGGSNIPAARALEHIAGYACFNDGSVRDWQNHNSQFTPGKNFRGTGGFGPWIVTPDEAGNLADQHVVTRLNGAIVQDQPISDMLFPVPQIIEYLSAFTTLSTGDVIATGTPGGVGMKRTPPLWMKPGDVVEVEIGVVGLLRNPVG
jgi:2-keto-4-pentenoate hydratase/2-oxohepta-3-ene-1,7-dioic acid hydratase in catechol pathway